ncbi:MAG: permease [Gemmatimonadales bacterium]
MAVFLWIVAWWQLAPAARWLTHGLLGLKQGTRLADSVGFFLFEAPKVLLLLVAVVFGVGILRSFVTPERTRRTLAGKAESAGNVLAAGLGVFTPFCSCSAVPLFIGFVKSGVPLGVTFSFLIAAPMVNEVALVLLGGLFGLKVALLYLGTGLAIAILAGWVIGRLHLEGWIESWVRAMPAMRPGTEPGRRLGWRDRTRMGREAVVEIVGRIWLWVLGGIAVGAAIHGYVPAGAMAHLLGSGEWWSVPLAVVLGVPMYSNAAGIIPIVQALMEKGAPLGSALAFMMSVVALSFPEMVILRKVLQPRLIAVFIGVVAAGIVVVGYLFNAVL